MNCISFLPDYISIFVLLFSAITLLITSDIINVDLLKGKLSLLYLLEYLVLYYLICNIYTLFAFYLSNKF